MRLLLARAPGYESDLLTFEQWSLDLGQHGPLHFYEGPGFADYLPGYLYFLWGAGLAARWIHFGHDTYVWILKSPSIIADLASCYLLYFILEEKPKRVRLLAALTYALLPTALFIGALWGQVDSLLSLGDTRLHLLPEQATARRGGGYVHCRLHDQAPGDRGAAVPRVLGHA